MLSARFHCGILLALCLAGCSEDKTVTCFPVSGTVLLNNQPLAEATIVLHPASGVSETQRPIGETDATGRFTLTTIKPADGAPPGEYQVTVVQRALVQKGEEMIRDGANQLPARYAQAGTSQLKITVAEGTNEVPPLQLTSP